jgi:hypothetical protein
MYSTYVRGLSATKAEGIMTIGALERALRRAEFGQNVASSTSKRRGCLQGQYNSRVRSVVWKALYLEDVECTTAAWLAQSHWA